MKRNTIEIIVAFFGLALVYYGVSLDQCLYAAGQPAPNCHSTPAGTTIFVVGFIVCWIGIAPWKIYARNYVCQVCGSEFGGGKEGKVAESAHFLDSHPAFYKWNFRWTRWTNVFVVFSFVYIIGVAILIDSVPSLNGLTDWWALGFVGIIAALGLDLADMHYVTKKFRSKWSLSHPEQRDPGTLRVESEKLSAGVAAWNEFTHGQEQYFGGLMAGGLKKRGNLAGGYGIYFTSQRIVGVKTSRWFIVVLIVAALAGIGGAVGIAVLVGTSPALGYFIGFPIIAAIIAWGQRRLRFQDPISVEELDRRKDFEIRRDNISAIDLKKPGVVKRGRMIVTPKTGKGLTLMITQEPGVFDRLKGLVTGFCFVPPSTWTQGSRLTINYPSPSNLDQQGADAVETSHEETQGVLDEKHVEKRDFEWCPHCAAMAPRESRVCPSCGKTISG